MLQITKFACEKCGKTFGTAEVAAACEKRHLAPTHIGEQIRYCRGKKLPHAVELCFGDQKMMYRAAPELRTKPVKKVVEDDDDSFDFDFDD